jgi:hypothetical protein
LERRGVFDFFTGFQLSFLSADRSAISIWNGGGRPVATDLDERHAKGYKKGLLCKNKMVQDGLGKADLF